MRSFKATFRFVKDISSTVPHRTSASSLDAAMTFPTNETMTRDIASLNVDSKMCVCFQVCKTVHDFFMVINEVFDTSSPIKIMSFLKMFQTACDSNTISESAPLWAWFIPIWKRVGCWLSSRLQLRSVKSSRLRKENELLSANTEVENHQRIAIKMTHSLLQRHNWGRCDSFLYYCCS